LLIKEKQGVPFLQFSAFNAHPEVVHGIFTREGGESHSPFDSLNVSYGVGDREDLVDANRRSIARCMDEVELIFIRQVHGTDVLVVTEEACQNNGSKTMPSQGDAMVTEARGKAISIQTADCQPVLLFDPVGKVAANAHSGWRGSIGNIVGRTVAVMTERFGSLPGDIIAGVGPSLGPCCAEFKNYQLEIPEALWGYKNQSVYFDFWALTRDQLMDAGLSASNIEIAGICTKCHGDRFFSYRQNKITGRCAAVIGLK
jgi:polyphenol oxidase